MAGRSGRKGALRDIARNRASRKPAAAPTPARPSRKSVPRPTMPKPQRKPVASRAPAPASRRSSTHTRGGTFGSAPAARKPPVAARKTGTRRETSSAGAPPLRRTAAQRFPNRGGTTRAPVASTPPYPTSPTGGARVTDLQAEVQQLQSRFSQLQAQAGLQDLYQRIGQFDARVSELPRELEALRSRGYIHAGLIDDDVASVARQWEETRPQIHQALNLQVNRLNGALAAAANSVSRLSPRNATTVAAANTALAQLQNQISAARNSVSGGLNGVEQPLSFLEQTIERFDWVLEQFHRSPNVVLMDAEAPLMATEAEWERSGEEGPDGILFLTDQRLLFEQNEDIATEKLFGLFATKKEKRQELLLDVPVREIEQIDYGQEGGFLGLGKAEKLNLILSAQAPVSRATFELRGQKAADWAVWVKRVQTGEIDEDRAAGYAAEVQAAEARAARFPSNCPNCLAPLPLPGRGAEYIVCDYCGTVVHPAVEVGPGEGAGAVE